MGLFSNGGLGTLVGAGAGALIGGPAGALIGGGLGGMLGGASEQQAATRAQLGAYNAATGVHSQNLQQLGQQELDLTQQQKAGYNQLAGDYRSALARSISRYQDRSGVFQDQTRAGLGQLVNAENAVTAGLPAPGGDRGWASLREAESAQRVGPARDLAALLMGEQSMRPYDATTAYDFQRGMLDMNQGAQQLDQRGMLGRAILDQDSAIANMQYQDALQSAQPVGMEQMARGQLWSGLGQIGLSAGIGSLGGGDGGGGAPTSTPRPSPRPSPRPVTKFKFK